MDRKLFAVGAVFAFLAVGAGAFGTHTLGPRLTEAQLATYETAASYQMYHALALLIVAGAVARWPDHNLFVWAGRLFIAGTIIFCATLYTIALGGPKWLGGVTPLGGLCFLAGWAAAAAGALRSGRARD